MRYKNVLYFVRSAVFESSLNMIKVTESTIRSEIALELFGLSIANTMPSQMLFRVDFNNLFSKYESSQSASFDFSLCFEDSRLRYSESSL